MSESLEQKVKSASPAGLVVLLFDEIIKRAGIVTTAIAAGKATDAQGDLERCLQIFRLLNSSLRPEHDPEFTTRVSALYDFFGTQLTSGYELNDAQKIEAVLPMIRELGEAWRQIDQQGPAA